MQRPFATFLAIGLLATVSQSLAAEQPIPQDRAAQEKRRRERCEWNQRTLAGAYEKVGKKDARWDKDAQEALEFVARMYAKQADPTRTYQYHVRDSAKRAVDAGCDDPLIRYVYADADVSATNTPDNQRRLSEAEDAMEASSYPPIRRAIILHDKYAKKAKDLSPEARLVVEKGFESVLALLPLSVAQDERSEFWQDEWFLILDDVRRTFNDFRGDQQAAFDRIDGRLAKIPEIKALRLQLRGRFLISYAWEARTDAFAPLVTEEGARKFAVRLREARTALTEAWAVAPNSPRTAALMLVVEKGIGGGNRAAMETWFGRAMKANGDNWDACWAKLDWLDPKWYGSQEEMLAFGRACRETKNYHEGITLLWGESLFRVMTTIPPADIVKFCSKAGGPPEIKAVYDEYLTHYPHDFASRNSYAALLFFAGDYVGSDRQFKAIGPFLRGSTFVSLSSIKRMRDDAAQRAMAR